MSEKLITNERMFTIVETIASQVRDALHERADDILAAWHENIEEAAENECKFPMLKVGMGAEVDLEGNRIKTQIRFTATYQTTLSAEMPDPNQPDLPGVSDLVKALSKAGTKISIGKP